METEWLEISQRFMQFKPVGTFETLTGLKLRWDAIKLEARQEGVSHDQVRNLSVILNA